MAQEDNIWATIISNKGFFLLEKAQFCRRVGNSRNGGRLEVRRKRTKQGRQGGVDCGCVTRHQNPVLQPECKLRDETSGPHLASSQSMYEVHIVESPMPVQLIVTQHLIFPIFSSNFGINQATTHVLKKVQKTYMQMHACIGTLGTFSRQPKLWWLSCPWWETWRLVSWL